MRRPNFKGWVSRELTYLSGENTLNLRRLAYLAQGSIPRLWERLALYAIATGKTQRLKDYLYRAEKIEELNTLVRKFEGMDFNDPEIAHRVQMPDRFKKALLSFKAAYEKVDTRNESKKLRWEKSVELQKKKGISTALICKALGLDAGNISAYLKHADIDRISLEKATDIMKYLNAV